MWFGEGTYLSLSFLAGSDAVMGADLEHHFPNLCSAQCLCCVLTKDRILYVQLYRTLKVQQFFGITGLLRAFINKLCCILNFQEET